MKHYVMALFLWWGMSLSFGLRANEVNNGGAPSYLQYWSMIRHSPVLLENLIPGQSIKFLMEETTYKTEAGIPGGTAWNLAATVEIKVASMEKGRLWLHTTVSDWNDHGETIIKELIQWPERRLLRRKSCQLNKCEEKSFEPDGKKVYSERDLRVCYNCTDDAKFILAYSEPTVIITPRGTRNTDVEAFSGEAMVGRENSHSTLKIWNDPDTPILPFSKMFRAQAYQNAQQGSGYVETKLTLIGYQR
ncbi:MAG: hypothetical protein AB7T49_16265 [Oligoflexales bacterium]